MSITINHNAMASNASRNLATTYSKLSTSVQRMSSGLRINSAADDAAGLAIREMMRADITATQQGIRNAADAISMIQTADGALGVIDEKLTRMKELAEQAATGTYTTVQRDIINSEYQAMAAEIDRIANATNFNGIKLLDGSVTNQHGGQGIKVHFGVSNNASEDYYFVNIGDARATSSTGLRVGGDAKNDIWGQGAAASGALAGPGCCTTGFSSLNNTAGFNSGQTFSFGYNWDWMEDSDTSLLSGKYLAGRYSVGSSDSLQDLVDKVNAGTQSRVAIKIGADLETQIKAGAASGAALSICVGDEAYVFGDMDTAQGYLAKAVSGTYTGTSGMGVTGAVWANAANNASLKSAGINLGAAAAITGKGQDKVEASAKATATSAMQSAVTAYATTLSGKTELGLTASTATGLNMTASSAAAAINTATPGSIVTSGATSAMAAGTTATIGTGIYADTNGNFTNSAGLATALGFKEVMATISTRQGSAEISTISYSLDGGASFYSSALTATTGSTIANLSTTINSNMSAAITAAQGAAGKTGLAGQITGTATTTPPTLAAVSDTTATYKTSDVKVGGIVDSTKQFTQVASAGAAATEFTATALASAINHNSASAFWAMTDQNDASIVYVFHKEGGDNNDIKVCEVAGHDTASRAALNAVDFQNVETGNWHASGTTMSLGGQNWGHMTPTQSKVNKGHEVWNVTLEGRDVGKERDLWIANMGDLILPGVDESIINGMDRDNFMEIQNAANANWAGAEVRTQSSAQESLDALTEAITKKDKIRADLGAMQNRLENTMTNLEIQAENLQSAESRISDVDVAKEMTEFTKNNVMVQAATSMLAQANSMSQLALSLMG